MINCRKNNELADNKSSTDASQQIDELESDREEEYQLAAICSQGKKHSDTASLDHDSGREFDDDEENEWLNFIMNEDYKPTPPVDPNDEDVSDVYASDLFPEDDIRIEMDFDAGKNENFDMASVCETMITKFDRDDRVKIKLPPSRVLSQSVQVRASTVSSSSVVQQCPAPVSRPTVPKLTRQKSFLKCLQPKVGGAAMDDLIPTKVVQPALESSSKDASPAMKTLTRQKSLLKYLQPKVEIAAIEIAIQIENAIPMECVQSEMESASKSDCANGRRLSVIEATPQNVNSNVKIDALSANSNRSLVESPRTCPSPLAPSLKKNTPAATSQSSVISAPPSSPIVWCEESPQVLKALSIRGSQQLVGTEPPVVSKSPLYGNNDDFYAGATSGAQSQVLPQEVVPCVVSLAVVKSGVPVHNQSKDGSVQFDTVAARVSVDDRRPSQNLEFVMQLSQDLVSQPSRGSKEDILLPETVQQSRSLDDTFMPGQRSIGHPRLDDDTFNPILQPGSGLIGHPADPLNYCQFQTCQSSQFATPPLAPSALSVIKQSGTVKPDLLKMELFKIVEVLMVNPGKPYFTSSTDSRLLRAT
jgi:hypothetical protein